MIPAGLLALLLGLGGRDVQVVAGGYHTLALGSDGRLWGWGANTHGQLGDGSTADRPLPFESRPPAGRRIRALACGEDHSVLLTEDGRVYTCGRNEAGQLGSGTTAPSTTWREVQGLEGVIQVAAGKAYTLALRQDGTVWGWGDTRLGQLGPTAPMPVLRPMAIRGLKEIRRLAAGATHALALDAQGRLWAWGSSQEGQAGRPPAPVPVPPPVKALAAGDGFSLALDGRAQAWAWGRNDHGQLGNGTRTARSQPKPVPGLKNLVQVAAGYEHALAQDRQGRWWSWGDNNVGQLGHSAPSYATQPMPVQHPTGPQPPTWRLSAGGYHTVIYGSGSAIFSFGYNHDSQLGDWTTQAKRTPTALYKPIP